LVILLLKKCGKILNGVKKHKYLHCGLTGVARRDTVVSVVRQRRVKMHCPTCGTELVIHDPSEKDKIKGIERCKCTCPKGCFSKEDGFPLIFHHPYNGVDSAPGDSWSLSWIK